MAFLNCFNRVLVSWGHPKMTVLIAIRITQSFAHGRDPLNRVYECF